MQSWTLASVAHRHVLLALPSIQQPVGDLSSDWISDEK